MDIKSIAVILLLACSVLSARAQNNVRYGVKAGLTSSELRFDGGGYDGRFGLNGGVFAVVPFRGAFSALLQADFYRKGYEQNEVRDANNTNLGTDADFQYDYTVLLVAAHYRAALGSRGAALYAFLGPRIDVFLGDRVVATNRDGERETFEVEGTSIFDTDFNATVLGASAGLGVDLANAMSVPLLIELRYDADLTPAWSPREDNDLRFRTFSLRAGLSF